ncbi:hypothetical protein ASF63_15725 [Microbacterium sp. Leaf320]|nr:hypothetical protein ASF63_15725 [Microbacterium sp. Leaf320]
MRRIGHDPAELEAFYREHIDAVEAFVARRVSDAHTVADVTADTFMRAVDTCRRYDAARGTARAWLLGIAYNVIVDSERRAARRWRAHSREGTRRLIDADALDRVDARIDAEEPARALRAAYTSVTGIDRALLELTAIDELSVTDAATAVGVSPGAARTRLYRVKQRLREHITTHAAYPPLGARLHTLAAEHPTP